MTRSAMVPLLILCAAFLMMACEALRPGRSYPKESGWWSRAANLEVVLRYALYPPSRPLLEIGKVPARVDGAPRLRYEALRPDALHDLSALPEAHCP